MDHASFIFGSWILTMVSVGLYSFFTVRRGKRLAQQASYEEMPWT
jgi:hypothetical protein